MTQISATALPADDAQPPLTQASLLPLLYAGDETYGWSAGMRAVTHALLDTVTLPDGAVVEVGCGGGQMLAELQHRYPTRTVLGMDLHSLALAQARQFLSPTVGLSQSALPHLPCPAGALALVIALDVFDQRGVELAAALAESYRVLAEDGALVLRLSAHPSLFGAHDVAFHTGQRYTRQQLHDALLAAGFVIQRLTYANTCLSLPVGALRLAQRWGMLRWQPAAYEQGALHQIAAWFLHREAAWLQRADLPWGISLCAVARKP